MFNVLKEEAITFLKPYLNKSRPFVNHVPVELSFQLRRDNFVMQ